MAIGWLKSFAYAYLKLVPACEIGLSTCNRKLGDVAYMYAYLSTVSQALVFMYRHVSILYVKMY